MRDQGSRHDMMAGRSIGVVARQTSRVPDSIGSAPGDSCCRPSPRSPAKGRRSESLRSEIFSAAALIHDDETTLSDDLAHGALSFAASRWRGSWQGRMVHLVEDLATDWRQL